MRILFLFLVALLIPAVTPYAVSLYVKYVPGVMVGSVDGWLGYLGGYIGGMLAFLSAYLMVSRQHRLESKCWINITTFDQKEKDIDNIRFSVIFPSDSSVNDFDTKTRRVLSWGEYEQYLVRLKNVSVNYAKSVSIRRKMFSHCYANPYVHRRGDEFISKYSSICELGAQDTMEFILHISPSLLKDNGFVNFMLSSTSLNQYHTKQLVKLHTSVSGRGCFA